MKRCPACNRIEADDTLAFCRADGTPLVSDSLAATNDSTSSSEIETSLLPHKDGTHVYFLRDGKSPPGKELWVISPASHEERLLGMLRMHPIGALYDVSPEGTIVYVRYSPGKPELWLADFPRN